MTSRLDKGAHCLRLDTFLWFVRMTKSRSLARALAESGHLRIDGRRTNRAHAEVRIGQVLAFPLHGRVRIIRIEALPARRGPAKEAQACYADLSPRPDNLGVANLDGGGAEP